LDVDADLVKGDRVFWDGFKRCFASSRASFLADFAGADIFDDVIFDSRPVVVLDSSVVGVILSLVASSGRVM
jgi:hypothetical protein